MAKRLRKAVAVAALSLFCLPLGACGSVAVSANPDAVDNIVPDSSAVYGYGVGIGENAVSPSAEENISDVEEAPSEPELPVEPPKSTEYDGAYLWDGDLVAAGWADTDANKAPAPAGYVLAESDRTLSIQNAAAFAYFAHQTSLIENDGFAGYTVNLDCDIDLGGDGNLWIPASFSSRKNAAVETDGKTVMFKGVFDGNGHTIYNFSSKKFYEGLRYGADGASVYVSDELSVPFTVDNDGNVKREYVYGLFAVAGNVTFKNLCVVDVDVDLAPKTVGDHILVTDCVGTVVGYVAGDCTISNITVGSDGSEQSQGRGDDKIVHTNCTGGIVGRVYAGKLNGKPMGATVKVNNEAGSAKILAAGWRLGAVRATDCKNYIDLGAAGDGDKKGGIVGYVVYHAVSKYDNCVNYGDLHGVHAGGITSYFQLDGSAHYYEDTPTEAINYEYTFENCSNYGDVTAQIDNPADGSWIGGIVGAVQDYANESAALYNKLFGFYDCFNYGKITTRQLKAAGGIVGEMNIVANTDPDNMLAVEFNRVFNYGDVAGYDGDSQGADVAAGGIFGKLTLPAGHSGTLIIAVGNCGAVTGNVSNGIAGLGLSELDKCTVKYTINAYK